MILAILLTLEVIYERKQLYKVSQHTGTINLTSNSNFSFSSIYIVGSLTYLLVQGKRKKVQVNFTGLNSYFLRVFHFDHRTKRLCFLIRASLTLQSMPFGLDGHRPWSAAVLPPSPFPAVTWELSSRSQSQDSWPSTWVGNGSFTSSESSDFCGAWHGGGSFTIHRKRIDTSQIRLESFHKKPRFVLLRELEMNELS